MRLINGQPVRYKSGQVYREACCDCRLHHLLLYRVVDKHTIEVIPFRDDWATRRARKRKK